MVTHLVLGGMRSVHCARAVYTALAGVDGITAADVVVGRATIEHDGRATAEALRAAVALVGYEVIDVREERRVLPTVERPASSV